jgi:hypothetical protein
MQLSLSLCLRILASSKEISSLGLGSISTIRIALSLSMSEDTSLIRDILSSLSQFLNDTCSYLLLIPDSTT